ncbi:MAG: 5-oxoprolinase subunit PxpB [Hyphomicrobiaceae bacterium]|nr:5-oxoprolinase subunit PxpB [Hyphomicrobiaceae bacterium]
MTTPCFLDAGDTALVVEFGRDVDRHASALVLALADRVAAAAIDGVVETLPTFRSLMVHYDPLRLSAPDLRARIRPLLEGLTAAEQSGRRWSLPACYDPSISLDLVEVAERTRLSVDDVIRVHSATTFHVYMLGFLPGFPYMGDLPPALELPRRQTPRVRMPKGAVAIAMRMCSVYSLESPGGWHVLSLTPALLWDPRRESAGLLAAGDKVSFVPVSLAEYHTLLGRAERGEWVPQPAALGGAP